MNSPTQIAKHYYTEMGLKHIDGLDQYLSPHVEFISPMATITGKDQVLKAAQHFMTLFTHLEIRHQLNDSDNTTMIVFDLICPPPIGRCRAATLMTIKKQLIIRMELFYDTKPFEQFKAMIFTDE